MPDFNACHNSNRVDERALEGAITACAATRLSFDEVNALRKQSATLPGAFGFSVLKHADEQTLAALAAVRDAIADFDSPPESFAGWGIVCSPRYLGRSAFAQSLVKFASEGPWNVSVQVVPNRSLHSPASMVGLGLGCHGPCIGVGGGLDGETDAWITAMSLLDEQSLPGMWLIFTGWEPDEVIDKEGTPLNGACCTALAIALQAKTTESAKGLLRIGIDHSAPIAMEVPAPMTALRIFDQFLAVKDHRGSVSTNLGGCLRAEMSWKPAAMSTIPLPNVAVERKAA